MPVKSTTVPTDVLSEALQRFTRAQTAVYEERLQCLDDRRFYSIPGSQWDDDLTAQFENKPRFEINKIHPAVMRIISEYRNNRITVDFMPRGGVTADELSDTCDGLYRADEQDSCGKEAYDNAFTEGIGGGMGSWRLTTEYEEPSDPDDDRQRIRFEPIYDADSCVFFDPNAKRYDKSDAQYAFVLTPIDIDTYRAEYEDDPITWPAEINREEFDWYTNDVVKLAEYFVVENISERVNVYQLIDDTEVRYSEVELEENPGIEERLNAEGAQLIKTKTIKRRKIHKYLMSGGQILEDYGYISGEYIPIIPFYGKRWIVDGKERCMGHVRLAKDAQRLKNMQTSQLAEIAAVTSYKKPIFLADQIVGHEQEWKDDNIKNYPFLLVNPVLDAAGNIMPSGPVGFTSPPEIPQALAASLQISESDLKDQLGNYQNTEEIVPNVSGKTVELIQSRQDTHSAVYLDNFKASMRYCGIVWFSIARDIYVEEGRQMKYISAQGSTSQVTLMQPKQDSASGEIVVANDLSKAKYDVHVDVGPTTQTRRTAAMRQALAILQFATDPEERTVMTSHAIMNSEGENMTGIRKWARRRLLQLGAEEPTQEEIAELQKAAMMKAQQPDPQTEYLRAAAVNEQAKAIKNQADANKVLAETEETQAKTEEIKADTLKTLTEIRVRPEAVEGRGNNATGAASVTR